MTNKETATSGGIGFFGILTLIFITLKLVGIVNWSWVWVLAPIWIPLALTVAIILVVFGFISLIATKKS